MVIAAEHQRHHAVEDLFVTPELAHQWLDGTRHQQRPIQRFVIANYARDLRAGLWKHSAQPIQLTADGQVLDGQHRLTAIYETGIGAWCLVVLNADPDTFDVIDIGSKRSPGIMLEFQGIVNGNSVAAVARLILCWERGNVSFSARVTNAELRPVAEEYAPALQKLIPIGRRGNKMLHVGGSILTFCAFLSNDGGEFLERALDLEEESTPAWAFRDACLYRHSRDMKTSAKVAVALFIQARNMEEQSEQPRTDARGRLKFSAAAAYPPPQWHVPLPLGSAEEE